MLLVAFWCSLGLLLRLSWKPFLASLGSILGHFGAFLGLSWRLLGKSCAPAGLLGQFLASSRPSLSLLNPHMIASSLSRSFLGASWGLLRPFRGCICSFSAQSKSFLSPPGRLYGVCKGLLWGCFSTSSAILSIARKLLETVRHSKLLGPGWGEPPKNSHSQFYNTGGD